MKTNYLLAVAVATVLGSCSSDELVNESAASKSDKAPIGFSVEKQNITRATNLETVNHFNFGAWAWKVNGKNSLADAEVMNNYLVGYSDETNKKGYDHNGATTWAGTAGTLIDHTSPWFYEGLGTAEYTSPAYGYAATATDYMSNNANQYLRYWDLAYANTNFYCYAPYVKNAGDDKKVTFNHTTGEMTFAANTIRDGYDETLNSAYAAFDRSLSEFMYAGVQATNADREDVVVPFKHMGAQLFIRFYEDIPGYRVELIDLGEDNGKMASSATGDLTKGIQVTPAKINGTSYELAEYNTTQGATVTFDANANATYTPSWTGSTTAKTNLMFQIPTEGKTTSADAPANLANYNGHKVIKEVVTTGTQEYSYSPTIYYAVAQPTTSETGLTFHVSYRIIAEDNQEVITVHNATVHVPYKDASDKFITVWQPNVKYTYSFKITKNSTGDTNPDEEINPVDPEVSTKKALYPIVFDGATIEDYTEVESNPTVTDGTQY
ncbi:fimbrillin family protein [Prevotella sp. E9-3]|uniref:fimbrillin family protein n=1 Tax=Prevotella sp. E9-3 TaxID=2913621 RepID=UPI001EDC7C6B|nr:fimbrillin family protein [Prevotella sp. E9-3]UKK48720.1 fimbrillin family protein [Prevotella sp. E9-3]